MTTSADRALALVADLADALAHAHTDVTLVPAAAAALARHVPLRWLELARVSEDGSTIDVVVHRLGAPGAARASRSMRGSIVADATEAGPRVMALAHASKSEAGSHEVRRARGDGADTLVLLPLAAPGEKAAYVLAALALASDPLPSRALLDAMARVLAAALRQVGVLGRVADLSRRAYGDNKRLRGEIERAVLPREVVAQSPAMHAIVHEVVPLIAKQDTTVLLRGETGTGKEVIARRIHALSPRSGRPFLRVNCGALPEALVESTLFGHERGAFTGAIRRHAGLFERAHGGTLLLDEIAELPRAAQAKLLRVLQEGEIERVGGEAVIPVDVRVIAATHRPLEAMVADGSFREDLYYRLHVFPIVVPPLRERPEDLPALAAAITARLAAQCGRSAPRIGDLALEALRAHAFPGNVRELENVLERALIVSTGDDLSIPRAFTLAPHAPHARVDVPAGAPPASFREAERRAIEAALKSTNGRVYGPSGAAALLGLKPTTLQSKMRKLGVPRT